MSNRNNKIFLVIGCLTILVLSLEVILRINKGIPALENDSQDFNYQYVDIYKDFFKQSVDRQGRTFFQAVRDRSSGHRFYKGKDQQRKRIFVIGGSVSLIFNDNPRIIEKIFSHFTNNENKFELIGCGMAAYDSYRIYLIYKEILKYQPDLIILMSGNNEYYSPVRVNLFTYRLNKLLRRFWVIRIIQNQITAWTAEVFKDDRIEKNLLVKKDNLNKYKANLRKVLTSARQNNVPIVITTLPVNFRDAPAIQRFPVWEDIDFFQAWVALDNKSIQKAKAKFEILIKRYPNDAFTHYCLARTYDSLGKYSKAKEIYLRALDLDALPGNRCTTERNQIIRQASYHYGAILIDLEDVFIKELSQGLLGYRFFRDDCHWWPENNLLVYWAIGKAIAKHYESNQQDSEISISQMKALIATQEPSFLSDLKRSDKEKALAITTNAFTNLERREVDTLSERVLFGIMAAYKYNLGLFDSPSLLRQVLYKKIADNIWSRGLLSEFDRMWKDYLFHIGWSLRRLGNAKKALVYFNQLIKNDPNYYHAYLGRGLVYYKLGLVDKAEDEFNKINKESNAYQLYTKYKKFLVI